MAMRAAWSAGALRGAGLRLRPGPGAAGGVVIWVINARCAAYTVAGGSEGTKDAMRRLTRASANLGDVDEDGKVHAKWAWRRVRWWRRGRSEGC